MDKLYGGTRAVFVDPADSEYVTIVYPGGHIIGEDMGKWQGVSDSRPEVSRQKVGKVDMTKGPKKVSYNPTGSEAFGDKMGGKKSAWKGVSDNR